MLTAHLNSDAKFRSWEDGGVGGPQTYLVPWTQLNNCQIILNSPEIDLKTDRTNSPLKREKGPHRRR